MPYSRLSSDISAVLPINIGPSFLYVITSYIIPSYNIASYNVIRQAAHTKGAVHHRTWTVPENASRSGAKNWAVVSAKHPIRKACPVLSGNSGTQFPQIYGDDPQPVSHAFKHAILKHKTADRMLFFKKYTSRNLPRLHMQLPFTVADYRPPIQTRNMSPKAGHLPAWLDFGQLLVS